MTAAHCSKEVFGVSDVAPVEGGARSVKTVGRILINDLMQLPYIQKLTASERHELVCQLDGILVVLSGV